MSDTGYVKGQCQNCGGHLEFPATGIGLSIDCPHCGSQTILTSNPAGPASSAGNSPARSKRKFPVLGVSALLALILATAGGAFYWFKKTAPNPPAAITSNSEMTNGVSGTPEENDRLQAGPVTLQKMDGSALVQAVGTVKNNSDRQRFGVKIELDLLDAQDHKIGTASDYLAVLEPHQDWQFRALLTQPKAVKVQVANITEQK